MKKNTQFPQAPKPASPQKKKILKKIPKKKKSVKKSNTATTPSKLTEAQWKQAQAQGLANLGQGTMPEVGFHEEVHEWLRVSPPKKIFLFGEDISSPPPPHPESDPKPILAPERENYLDASDSKRRVGWYLFAVIALFFVAVLWSRCWHASDSSEDYQGAAFTPPEVYYAYCHPIVPDLPPNPWAPQKLPLLKEDIKIIPPKTK